MSDLHVQNWAQMLKSDYFAEWTKTDADTVILAGDIVNAGLHFKHWDHFKSELARIGKPYQRTIFVPGNHEFYGTSIVRGVDAMLELEQDIPNLVFLYPGRIFEHEGYRFLGATMWQPAPKEDEIFDTIADHNFIQGFAREAPEQFKEFESFLREQLKEGDIVVTHHAPSNGSLAKQWEGDLSNRFFITPEMEPLILERKPALWVHGHVHTPFDYMLGNTRIVCNPQGYPTEGVAFNPTLVLDFPSKIVLSENEEN